MHIVIIGTGYVGLVTGACFSDLGHNVSCLDIDKQKIATLQKGISPIFEPGLEELIQKGIYSNRLRFIHEHDDSSLSADLFFMCLPTPSGKDGDCDLSYLTKACQDLAPRLHTGYRIIVNKSTVPVGTAEMVKAILSEGIKKDVSFDVVSNPEFLKEGKAIEDFMHPDRIIIGTENQKPKDIMQELYKSFSDTPTIFMDAASAEMTKYAANAMLACRISFMNELAHLAEKFGANIKKIKLGIGLDKRIGSQFLEAGLGYGGSCFPKDIKAINYMAQKEGLFSPILQAIDTTNRNQVPLFVDKIIKTIGSAEKLKGLKIAILGLAFKAFTDDIRESKSLELINELSKLGCELSLFDPVAMENTKQLFDNHPSITFSENEYACVENSDALVLVTEWPQFKVLDFNKIMQKMKKAYLFDGRNFLDKNKLKEMGFYYYGIGN
ncbi:MAG: UDP-glucose dehydrogenase family protein [Rhabdochlamydiaceae bacterium]